VALSHSPSIVTNGLILCLDAANPKSYPGSGTTWTDLSGNGNTGTLTNGPTYSSANLGSIKFDATDDYVVINDSNTLDLTTALTLSIWFNRGDILTLSAGDQHNYIVKGNTQAPGGDQINYSVGIATTGGRDGRYFWRHDLVSATNTFAPPSSLFSANQWYNLVITHVSGSTPIPYLNGVVQTNWTMTSGSASNPLVANTYKTTISGDAERPAPESNRAATFNGRMSNVSIYNRALTAAEVRQNFNALRGRFGI
jgi:hypothetical protein